VEYRNDRTVIHYVEHGAGVPLVALHGAGVDHRELQAAVEPVVPGRGYRRIYPDLPGMGRSTADGLSSNSDVVRLLGHFIEHVATGPVLLLGHSYGAYLARAVAGQRPDLVLGLALLCPFADGSPDVPAHAAVHQEDEAYSELEADQRAGFDGYFVVRTPATARRYRDHIAAGTTLVNQDALGRIFAQWTVDRGPGTFSAPTLIAAGRCDATVGYAGAMALFAEFPQATLAVIDGAGHALLHERPAVVSALVGEWLDRTDAHAAKAAVSRGAVATRTR
jgi:pimeloyl-ACP methyl ester carboxylesterase